MKPGDRRCQLSVEIEGDDWISVLAFLEEISADIRQHHVQRCPLVINTSIQSGNGTAYVHGYERPLPGVS